MSEAKEKALPASGRRPKEEAEDDCWRLDRLSAIGNEAVLVGVEVPTTAQTPTVARMNKAEGKPTTPSYESHRGVVSVSDHPGAAAEFVYSSSSGSSTPIAMILCKSWRYSSA